MVVGFDANHPFFHGSHDIYRVEYSKDRIALSSVDGCLRLAGHYYSQKSNYKDLPVRLFLRKSLGWSYEEEIRIVRRLDEADRILPGNPGIYLFAIPEDAIKILILGLNMSAANKTAICKSLAATTVWRHLKVLQANLSDKGFGLGFSDFDCSAVS